MSQTQLVPLPFDAPCFMTQLQNGMRVLCIETLGEIVYAEWGITKGYENETHSTQWELHHFLEHLNGAFTSPKWPHQLDIMNALADMGFTYQALTDLCETSYSIIGEREFFPLAFDIFFSSLSHFQMEVQFFQQEKSAAETELWSRVNSDLEPFYLFLNRFFYPKGHIRTIPMEERISNLRSFHPVQMETFRAQTYDPRSMFIILAGRNVSELFHFVSPYAFDVVDKRKRKRGRGLVKRETSTLTQHLVPAFSSRQKKFIFPLGQIGPHILQFRFLVPFISSDPLVPVLNFLIQVFGGQAFSSRLMEIMRVQKGLVYGMSATMELHPLDPSLSSICFAMRSNGPWEELVDLFCKEIVIFWKNGITREEFREFQVGLTREKNETVLNQHPLRFVSMYRETFLFQNKLKHAESQYQEELQLKREDLNALIRILFQPSSLFIFIGQSSSSSFPSD